MVAFVDFNAASKIHGLLGLDFLRGRILTLDFPRGTVTLALAIVAPTSLN